MRFFAQRATALRLAATIALAFVLYVGGSDPTGATFTPTGTARFCNGLEADFPSSKPGTDSDLAGDPSCIDDPIPASTAGVDLTTSFTLPGGDSIFASSIINNLPGTVSADAAIPDGEKVGGLRSDITLSLLNGPCATSLVAEFERLLDFVAVVQGTDGEPSPLSSGGASDAPGLRPDQPRPDGEPGGPVGHRAIEKNAPKWTDGAFETPKVVG